jgi:WD40 repeat protein
MSLKCPEGHDLREVLLDEANACSICLRPVENHSFLKCQHCTWTVCGDGCLQTACRRKHTLEAKGAESLLQSVEWSPDDRYVASWDENGILYTWEAATGTVAGVAGEKLVGDIGAISGVEWSQDSKYITTLGVSQSRRVWEAATGSKVTLEAWSSI